MLPAGYNNNIQFVQTPGYVVILTEMIHDARVIPLDGRPRLPATVRRWTGDPRGRWEGDTLVVDVTGLRAETWFDRAGNFHSDALHVVERFTRTSPDVVNYDVSIDDPKVFTRPWKMTMPVYRRQEKDLQLLEYECYPDRYDELEKADEEARKAK